MKRLLFKRLLAVPLGLLLLLSFSFVVSPSAFAAPASSTPFSAVVTTTACASALQTITTFHTGDTVSGTVNYVNVNDSAENTEGETLLVLKGVNVPALPPVTVDSGPQSFSFTASGDGTLQACINGADGDEQATIAGTVVTAPVPVPTPTPSPHGSNVKLIKQLRDLIISLRPKVDVDRFNKFVDAFNSSHEIKECVADITEGVKLAVPIIIEGGEVLIPQFPASTGEDCASAFPDILDILKNAKVDPKDTPLFIFSA